MSDSEPKTATAAPVEVSTDDADMAEMERVAARLGKEGNVHAIEVSRRIRAGRQRPVAFALPNLDTREGIEAAQVAVIAAAADGRMTPRDALGFSTMLENRRRALAAHDLEERLRKLEQINAAKAGGKR